MTADRGDSAPMNSVAPSLPVVIRRPLLALPYALATAPALVIGVDMIRRGWLVGWRLVGAALVIMAVLSGAAAVVRFRARVVVGAGGISVRNWRREISLAWSEIRIVGVLPWRSGNLVSIEPSAQAPTHRAIPCAVLRSVACQDALSTAMAAAGHTDLDRIAESRHRLQPDVGLLRALFKREVLLPSILGGALISGIYEAAHRLTGWDPEWSFALPMAFVPHWLAEAVQYRSGSSRRPEAGQRPGD